MSIYGDQIVNEAVLFISKDGKQLKKELKQKMKEFNIKGLGNKLKAGLTKDYNEDIRSKCEKVLKEKLNIISQSKVYKVIVVTDSGSYTEYYQQFHGFYKDKLYTIKLYLHPSTCYITTFDELDLSNNKCIIDKDIVELILRRFKDKGYLVHFHNSKVTFEKYGTNASFSQTAATVINEINARYDNLEAKAGKLTTTISFKKK